MNDKTVNMKKFYQNCNITKEELQRATDIVRAIAVNTEFLKIEKSYNSIVNTVNIMKKLLKLPERES